MERSPSSLDTESRMSANTYTAPSPAHHVRHTVQVPAARTSDLRQKRWLGRHANVDPFGFSFCPNTVYPASYNYPRTRWLMRSNPATGPVPRCAYPDNDGAGGQVFARQDDPGTTDNAGSQPVTNLRSATNSYGSLRCANTALSEMMEGGDSRGVCTFF